MGPAGHGWGMEAPRGQATGGRHSAVGRTAGVPSMRLMARRITRAEGLAAALIVAITRAHSALISRQADTAAEVLRIALRAAAQYEAVNQRGDAGRS